MFKLINKKIYPIAIDLGSSSLKMVQLIDLDGGLGLVAAARVDVPSYIQGHATALQEWYCKTIREAMAEKPFKGRRVVTALPSREMLVQHLRVSRMGEEELVKALPWEAQEKVPFDIHKAMLQHIVAGEVYDGSDIKQEIILMVASNHVVNQHLQLFERAKLEISHVNVEPCALIKCFSHLMQQTKEPMKATMFVDLGHHCSKVVVTHGSQIVFCRTISIAAEHLRRAISDKLSVEYDRADQLYQDLELDMECPKPVVAHYDVAADRPKLAVAGSTSGDDLDLFDGDIQEATATLAPDAPEADSGKTLDINEAVTPTLNYLYNELRSCVRYHDLMFETIPLERVIFLGGMSRNKSFCQKLARGLGLPAQLGDPVARIAAESRMGDHSDLDPGQACSDWAIAFGLCLGGK